MYTSSSFLVNPKGYCISLSLEELETFVHHSGIGIMCVAVPAILSTLCSRLQRSFSLMLPYQSIANLGYLPAASPNSHFSGLPLLIQPSELCIIHSQHVVGVKCRNAFSSIINNSCSEKREQNAKWKAGWKCQGKQLNQPSDLVGFN